MDISESTVAMRSQRLVGSGYQPIVPVNGWHLQLLRTQKGGLVHVLAELRSHWSYASSRIGSPGTPLDYPPIGCCEMDDDAPIAFRFIRFRQSHTHFPAYGQILSEIDADPVDVSDFDCMRGIIETCDYFAHRRIRRSLSGSAFWAAGIAYLG